MSATGTSSASRATRPPGLLHAAVLVAREELRASLRDKQTALYTLLLPLVLYPVLFWALIQGWLVVQGLEERTGVVVALGTRDGSPPPAELVAALEREPGQALGPPGEARAPEADGERAGAGRDPAPEAVRVEVLAGALDEARARELLDEARRSAERGAEEGGAPDAPPAPDAVLLVGAAAGAESGAAGTLFHDGSRSRSKLARKRVGARFEARGLLAREEALARAGLSADELEPFTLDEEVDVARGEDVIAFVLSFVLPILVVVMTVMGAFFPAVDLSAGERERGTLETTLSLPVPRRAVHQGKILAVGTSSVVACLLNLLALGLSGGHLLGMLAPELELSSRLPWMALLAVLPLLVLFSFFTAAVLTGLASLARTFKEGQALLGPVQLAFLLPAMAGALPGLRLDAGIAFVPVVNVVLAFRSLLRGELLPLEYLLTALSLLVYAALASLLAERLLARESRLGSSSARGKRKRGRRAEAPAT